MREFDFYSPTSVPEALELLDKYKDSARIVAGGTDIVLELNERKLAPANIVDITKLSELNYIREDGDVIRIGAMTTHAEIADSELLKGCVAVLPAACETVGSPQIRHLGTIGGNIANASVAGDGLCAMVTLGASVTLKSKSGERTMPILEFFDGEGYDKRNALKSEELLTEISFPKPGKNSASAFYKLAKRKSLAISVISGAMFVETDDEGVCTHVSMRGGALGRYTMGFDGAEAHLKGKKLTRSLMDETLVMMHDQVLEVNKNRPWSVYYKKESVKGVFSKLFDEICKQLSIS